MAKINYKRLAVEIAILVIIITGIMLAYYLPWESANIAPDKYREYKTLYHEVENYNFNKGPNQSLSDKLQKALNDQNSSSTQVYFDLRARANYYIGLGYHNTAIVDLERALDLTPGPEEYVDTLKQLVQQAHLVKDLDREVKYQQYLDRIK